MGDWVWIISGIIAAGIVAYVLISDELDGGPGDWMQ